MLSYRDIFLKFGNYHANKIAILIFFFVFLLVYIYVRNELIIFGFYCFSKKLFKKKITEKKFNINRKEIFSNLLIGLQCILLEIICITSCIGFSIIRLELCFIEIYSFIIYQNWYFILI